MIKLLLLDINGVLTDGKVLIDREGWEYKQLEYKDIDAILEAKRNGLQVGFITGESGEVTNYFQERFKPGYFYSDCKDKKEKIVHIASDSGIDLIDICYIGDNEHDLEAIKIVGLCLAPANAIETVKKEADYVLSLPGGSGAVKEAVDFILHCVNKNGSKGHEYNLFQKVYSQHIEMMQSIINDKNLPELIVQVAQAITDSLNNGGQVLLCGNGGSAADAQHLATELISRFYLERKAFNAEALTTNTSLLTAIGNDYDFKKIFSRQVEAKGKRGDLLVGITTSGNSLNVVEALKTAREKDIHTVVLTGGFEKTLAEEYGDLVIKVPSQLTPRIQEGHIFIGHFICELVEKSLVAISNTDI